MHQEDDYYDFMELFDKPQEEKKKHVPRYCSICGHKTDLLNPYVVGKTTLYVCFFCESILKEPKDLIDGKEVQDR